MAAFSSTAFSTSAFSTSAFSFGVAPVVITDTHDGFKHERDRDRKKKLKKQEFRAYLERLFYGPLEPEIAKIVAPYETAAATSAPETVIPALDWNLLYKDIELVLAEIDAARAIYAAEQDDEETIMLLLH